MREEVPGEKAICSAAGGRVETVLGGGLATGRLVVVSGGHDEGALLVVDGGSRGAQAGLADMVMMTA